MQRVSQIRSTNIREGVWGEAPGKPERAVAYADIRAHNPAPCEALPQECKVSSCSSKVMYSRHSSFFISSFYENGRYHRILFLFAKL